MHRLTHEIKPFESSSFVSLHELIAMCGGGEMVVIRATGDR